MGNRCRAAALGAVTALSALCAAPVAALEACDPATLWITGDFGQARFNVTVVDTPGSRAQGLMFVEKMAASSGMLFVYDTPQPVAFWMKNTLIPLDMIFADAGGGVRRVHANAVPGDLTSIPGGTGIQYVLEINGGLARALGIDEGAQLWHPSIAARTPSGPCTIS